MSICTLSLKHRPLLLSSPLSHIMNFPMEQPNRHAIFSIWNPQRQFMDLNPEQTMSQTNLFRIDFLFLLVEHNQFPLKAPLVTSEDLVFISSLQKTESEHVLPNLTNLHSLPDLPNLCHGTHERFAIKGALCQKLSNQPCFTTPFFFLQVPLHRELKKPILLLRTRPWGENPHKTVAIKALKPCCAKGREEPQHSRGGTSHWVKLSCNLANLPKSAQFVKN